MPSTDLAIAPVRGPLPSDTVKSVGRAPATTMIGGPVTTTTRYAAPAAAAACAVIGAAVLVAVPARADNKRLNDGVVSNVYTVQRHAGCTGTLTANPQLRQAAQWHTDDVSTNRALDGDVGSDGTGPQQRAANAGYPGVVAET